MQIFVKTIGITNGSKQSTLPLTELTEELLKNGKTLSFCVLEISLFDSIEKVKEMLRGKEGMSILPNEMRLFNGGRELQNNELVEHCELIEGSLLYFVSQSKYRMTIFIENPNRKAFTLEVEPSNSIKNVKSQIQEKENILSEQIILSFAEKDLKDDETLNDCGVQKGSVLHMKFRHKNLVEIFIETLYDKAFILEFDRSDTVEFVKSEIEQKEGTSCGQIRLFFAGMELENRRTLDSYNIENESIFHMVSGTRHITMQISVKLTNGNSLTMEVESSDSVGSLKTQIQDKLDVPFDEIRILFAGRELTNDETIGGCNITRRSALYLVTFSIYAIQIFIKTPTGKIVTLDVKPLDDVKMAKTEVRIKENVSEDQLRLFFLGIELEDGKTFSHYGIEKGSLLHTYRSELHFSVSVGMPDKTYTMKFEPSNIIDDVKVRLQDITGISTDEMALFVNNKKLEGHDKLSDISDGKRSALRLRFRCTKKGCTYTAASLSKSAIAILIKTVKEKSYYLKVERSCTVANLKHLIQHVDGTPVDQQRFLFKSKQLRDDRTLSYYGVESKSVIHLDPRLEET